MKFSLTPILILVMFFSVNVFSDDIKDKQIADLTEKIRVLEERVGKIEQYLQMIAKQQQIKNISEALKETVRKRFEKDKTTYTKEQLQDIEALYQTANKNWNSPEAKESLKKLIEQYPKANRTGCAVLYLAQMNNGDEKEKLLKEAIARHSDCVYGNAVQIGAFARLQLADHYLQTGKTQEAENLYSEILKSYPDAVDHNGRLIKEIIKK